MAKKNLTASRPKTPVSVPAALVNLGSWYLNTYKQDMVDFMNRIATFLNNPATLAPEKAAVLLTGSRRFYLGCHQWNLWSWNRKAKAVAESGLIAWQPWTLGANYANNSFEDLFADVDSHIRAPYVAQLPIYDISLRLTYCWPSLTSLKPTKWVYVHNIPLLAYRSLVACGYLTNRSIKGANHVPYSDFAQLWPQLDAIEIEDLLCELGKEIRNYHKQQGNNIGNVLTTPQALTACATSLSNTAKAYYAARVNP